MDNLLQGGNQLQVFRVSGRIAIASLEKITCADEAEYNELKQTQLLARGRAKLNK